MPAVTYIEHDGTQQTVEVPNGDSVMSGAVSNMVRGIAGECGGGLACATCHCYVDDAWIDRVGLTQRIEVVADDARRVLEDVPDASQDIVFIDAFKVDYPEYLDHAVRITRPGGLIVADNTLHKGRVALADPPRAQTVSIKSYNETVFGRADLVSVLIPVGDGFTLSAVAAGPGRTRCVEAALRAGRRTRACR